MSRTAPAPAPHEFGDFRQGVEAARGRHPELVLVEMTKNLRAPTAFVEEVADVLRRQAEDLRHRRRERALQLASGLPVKLLVPLVACFLPGIAVAMLGPTFYEFFQFVDTLMRTRGLSR